MSALRLLDPRITGKTAGWILLLAAGAVGVLRGGIALLDVLSYTARGAIDGDVQLYFLVGRGMLNGLTPYADLFESKPPGMFFLTAFSLLFSRSGWLFNALNVSGLLLLPLLPALYAWKQERRSPLPRRLSLTFLGMGIGLLLTLYVTTRAIAGETESFGSVFASLYVLTVAWTPAFRGRWLAVRSALLLLSVGMKETFLLTTLAAALLLVPDARSLLQLHVLPLCIAAGTSALLLLSLGYLGPYLSVYLPAMMGHRIGNSAMLPLPLAALDVYPVFVNLTSAFPSAPLLGYLIGFLWGWVPLFWSKRNDARTAIGTVVASWTGFAFLHVASVFVMGLYLLAQGFVIEDTSLLHRMGWWTALLTPVMAALLLWEYRRSLVTRTLLIMIALYCISITSALVNYSGNHFVAAIPVYVATTLLALRSLSATGNTLVLWTIGTLTVASLIGYATMDQQREVLRSSLGNSYAAIAESATRVDLLLEECNIDRYYPPLPFTTHSPWGPLPDFVNHQYLGQEHPLVQQTVLHLARDNEVFLTGRGSIDPLYRKLLEKEFTKDAPVCARPFLPLPSSDVWFRSSLLQRMPS